MAHFTTPDGLRLYYDDQGHGPPILCLAGLTRNSDDFTYVLPHLSEYRVIRMDYRGRGQSDHAPDYLSYNIGQEALDAIALLDHLGLERATILGTSRGGLIAMALSVTHAQRLSGVILNDIGPEVAPAGIERIMDYVGKEPPFADLDAAAVALKAGHDAGFPGVSLDRWREQAGFMWLDKPGGGVGLRYDPHLRDALLGQAGTGQATPDLWRLFDGLSALPCAALRGANSDLLSADTFAAMQARIPGLLTATVPDRGHVPFLDEPEALTLIHRLLEKTQ